MNLYLTVTLGVVIWLAVFVFLLVVVAISADIGRRWNQSWIREWEKRYSRSIDDLIGRLEEQMKLWKLARRLMSAYLVVLAIVLVGLCLFQGRSAAMSADAFQGALLFGGVLLGLFFLPVWVVCEIGLFLTENMHRQIRLALGEKIIIRSAQEIDRLPRRRKEKKEKSSKQ